MNENIDKLSQAGRIAIQRQDWAKVSQSAIGILNLDQNNAEGFFLAGIVERVAGRLGNAIRYFEAALNSDSQRYDAAVELANQYSRSRRNGHAASILKKYEDALSASSVYSDLAGSVYSDIGMPERAYPLYKQAVELQPNVDLFQANLASCSVFLGKIDEAKVIYESLLQRFPNHQRNHYQLSRLAKARDDKHISQMLANLPPSPGKPERNIFMYFAIAKELEDLGRWEEAFAYYKKGGDAVCSVAKHDVNQDIALIDKVIANCTSEWIEQPVPSYQGSKQPLFVVGLPRTGTTLCERIISNHSQVETLGETLFFQMVLKQHSGVQDNQDMTLEMLDRLVDANYQAIAEDYVARVSYRLLGNPFFIDKLPFNVLYLGHFAKAFPKAKIVYLHRHPMDACFAMYKQVFTWAYKYSYSLDDLGRYYVAFDRLMAHWRKALGDRLIVVNYEDLVSNTDRETHELLDKLGLPFEQACIDFDTNSAPSTTASSVQVREKAHNKSVNKWRKFESQLSPLSNCLKQAGIDV